MGIDKSWQSVTEQEKALARLNVIYKAMGQQGAVGDAARTMRSMANQLKALQSQAKDAAIQIGTALIPAATTIVTIAADAAKQFGEWAKNNTETIVSIATMAVKLGVSSAAFYALGTAAKVAAVSIRGFKLALAAATAHPIIAGVTAVTASFIALDKWVEKTYRHTVRLGKKFADLGPPQPLTPEQQKGGPYMLDRMGNPILDMKVSDYYGDGKDDKPKSPFSNGKGFGAEKGVFSNGQTIGGANDPWDNPRSVPFAANPLSAIPMAIEKAMDTARDTARAQANNARLGLNGIEQNTSDPSGRAGAAVLKMLASQAADALQGHLTASGLEGRWNQAKDAFDAFKKNTAKAARRNKAWPSPRSTRATLPCSSVARAKPRSCWRRFATTPARRPTRRAAEFQWSR